MRRRATVLLPLAAAGIVAYLLREVEMGRAREPVARRADAARADAETFASAPPEEAPSEPEALVAGIVRDGDGHPFVGARVRLYPGGAPSGQWTDVAPVRGDPASEVTTAADGRFTLTARGGGPWTLAADAPAHMPAHRFVLAGSAEHLLVLARGTTQRLRVVDDEGAPLPEADALVFQGSETVRMAAKADAAGRIEFIAAPRDLVVVRAPGFAWELLECPVKTAEIALDREYRIGGVAVTGDEKPAAGVRLSFERYLWIADVVTAADGSFLVGGFGEGEVELTIARSSGEWQRDTVQAGDERLEIVVPTASVDGVVLLPDGHPASGASVEGGEVVCDENGRFVLKDVWPGDRTIDASLRGPGTRLEGRAELVIGGEDVKGIRITLEPAPLSFVRVSVVGPDGPVEADVRRDDGKNWATYRWRPDGPGHGVLEVEDVPGTEVRLSARGNPDLSGTVHTVTGASLKGSVVTLRLEPPKPAPPPTIVTVVCRGPDGSAFPEGVETSARIEGLRAKQLASDGPGRHRFQVSAREDETGTIAGYAAGHVRTSLRWTPSPADSEVEIRLRPAVRVVGRVFDPDAPAAADIDFTYSIGGLSLYEFDPSGRFFFDAEPGVDVEITAGRGPIPGVVLSLEVPATGPLDLGDLRLEKPWILRGTVTDEGGAPVGGATVTLHGPDGFSTNLRVVSRGDGTFRLKAPPSDLYTVVAEKGAGCQSDPVPAATFLKPSQTLPFR
ncbi:MAG: carboxypeptidase regulatory-like domain-containing protein [Actinobacteria bacterium]|nr:carboxypeptidase regulatory-like domain-containing protein [Actinomycetota bacterium]